MKYIFIDKKRFKVFIIFIFILALVIIPKIYRASNNTTYDLEKENNVIKEDESFKISIKNKDLDGKSKIDDKKIYLKIDKKILLEESIFSQEDVEYNFDKDNNILELFSKDIENVNIPLKATESGKANIGMYLEDEKIDEEIVIVEEKDRTVAYEGISSSSFMGISPASTPVTVTNGEEFHAAMRDKTITEINIGANFAVTGKPNDNYMNAYRRPVGTNIIINGNGHTVDFRNTTYSFNSTSSTNHNSITLKNIDLQGQNYYGPIMMDGVANTGGSITYENVDYEGSQMTSAYVADIYIKGTVNSKSVGKYVSKIGNGTTTYNTNGGNQQNLDVTNVTFKANSVYNGYAEDSILLHLRNGGSAVLEENAVVNLERDGTGGELSPYVTLYLQGNLDLEKNSKLNVKTKDTSTAGGIRVAGTGKYIRVKEGAAINVNTNGKVTADADRAGISVGDSAILDIESGGKIDINMLNMSTSTASGIYTGTSAKVNVKDDALLNIATTGLGTGITTGGTSTLNVGKRAKLNVDLGNIATSTRSGIATGTSSSFIVEEDGLLDVELYGAGTGVKVGGTSTFKIAGKGKMNISLKNTGTSISPALDSAANSAITIEKDGIVDIKSDGTASKKLINIAAGTNSKVQFSDAKRINLEFTEIPNSGSKLIYMPYGYLSVDIQSAKIWNKNSISVDELTPTKSWIPIWTPNGVKTVEYDASGNTKKVSASSVSQTLATDFNTNFKTENYRKILFEGIPDVTVSIDSLSNNPSNPNSHTITGKTNPGAYVRFYVTGTTNIPQGSIQSPLDSEKTDPSKNYHTIADSNGDYSYSLPSGSYFVGGDIINAYSYLNGKYAENKTIVENLIHVPDLNLRKAINKELKVRLTTQPIRDDNLEYYSILEMESLINLTHMPNGLPDTSKIKDLKGLEYALNLTNIDFSYNKIQDITPVLKLSKLNKLILNTNIVSNISSMENMLGLEELNLVSNKVSDTDIVQIAKATNLKILQLNNNISTIGNKISDISPISSLTKLTEFTARDNNISDIQSLNNLLLLNKINLGFNKITDISPIEKLTNLNDVDLTRNNISDLTPLESLTKLEALWLGRNQISDLTPLTNLTDLKTLNLYENKVQLVEVLRNKNKLTYLFLNNNQIIDISPLTPIFNNITDFSALNQVRDIGTVKINGNKLSLDNPVKNIGTSFAPITTISNSGTYDSGNNIINWTGISIGQNSNFNFLDSVRKFGGIVNLRINRVGIKDPTNPDIDNINVDPNGVPDLNHDLKLAINYIEPIDFGTVDIESRNMEIKAVTKTPYVQLTDLRDLATGWKLGVKGSKLTGASVIEGVKLRLKGGDTKSSPVSYKNLSNTPILGNDIVVSLDNSSTINVMNAGVGKGLGTWLATWQGAGVTNEKVLMEVPEGKARVGKYTTTLTWELSDTP